MDLDPLIYLNPANTFKNSPKKPKFKKKIKENFDAEPSELHYQPPDGQVRFKEAMCYVFNKYFNPAVPVKTEHLICGAGVTAMVAQLFYTICDEGDCVLISKPYYPGFDFTLSKQGVTLIGFDIENPWDSRSVFEALENAYQKRNQSQNIKSVILCNPQNPMGYCASKDILIAYLKFCETHQLHLVVDEVYGLSVFRRDDDHPESSEFLSTLSLNPAEFNVDPSRLHVLYGISKDFGCCGFRAGCLVSQNNSSLFTLMKKLTLNQVQISTLTGSSFFRFVFNKDQANKTSLLDSYLIENRRQLLRSYEYVTERLDSLKIKYNEGATSGFFLMLDLSRYLPNFVGSNEQSKEESCFLRLLNEHKIYLAPGMFFHHPKPGFFRLTFTAHLDHLTVALQRLSEFVRSCDNLLPPVETSES